MSLEGLAENSPIFKAHNAAQTLRIVCEELMAQSFVNLMILIDNANGDETVAIAKAMNQVRVHICERNVKAFIYTCNGIFRPEK